MLFSQCNNHLSKHRSYVPLPATDVQCNMSNRLIFREQDHGTVLHGEFWPPFLTSWINFIRGNWLEKENWDYEMNSYHQLHVKQEARNQSHCKLSPHCLRCAWTKRWSVTLTIQTPHWVDFWHKYLTTWRK